MEKIGNSINKVYKESPEQLKEFYLRTLENMSDAEKKRKKIQLQLLVILFGYFLLTQSTIESFEFGPFKCDNLDLIIKMYPLVISFTLNEYFSVHTFLRMLHEISNNASLYIFPKIAENGLSQLLKSDDNMIMPEIFAERNNDRGSFFLKFFFIIIELLKTFIFPILLMWFSLQTNFIRFGYTDTSVWFVFAISIILIFNYFLFFFQLIKQIKY